MKIFLLIFFLFSLPLRSEPIPGQVLLNYFKSNCSSSGDWTKQALNDSISLIKSLQAISDDPDCRTVSGSISQLQNLYRKLQGLENQNYIKLEIARFKAQETELINQLTRTNDITKKDEISTLIRNIQVQKASLKSENISLNNLMGKNIQDLYISINNTTNSAFRTIVNNHKCVKKSPGIIAAASSMASSIGSAVSQFNPAIGLGLSATADFIGIVTENIRRGKMASSIRKIADHSTLLEGYRCTLEALSNRWCQIDDADRFLKFKAKIKKESSQKSGLLSVVRYADRELPVLLNWLEKIRIGVPASNSSDSERQKLIFEREASVKSARSAGDGIITQNFPLYDLAKDKFEKWNIIKKTIIVLAHVPKSFSRNDNTHNPLFDIYSNEDAPYILLGLQGAPKVQGRAISFNSFNPFSPNAPEITLDLNQIKRNYNIWVDQTKDLVDKEMNLVLRPDPLELLTSASTRTDNIWKLSSKDSLDDIIDFLVRYTPSSLDGGAYKQIYEDTISRLKKISYHIDYVKVNFSENVPKKALTDIFEQAQLKFGIIFLKTRLEMALKISLDQYYLQLGPKDQNIAAQLLSADSFLDILKKSSGKDSLVLLKKDVENAKSISTSNMLGFLEVFGSNINKILKKIHKLTKDQDPSISQIYHNDLATLCLHLSSFPRWPNSVSKKYCYGTQLLDINPGGPSSSLITKDFLNRNFIERSCGYRNYIRKSKIYTDWGIIL